MQDKIAWLETVLKVENKHRIKLQRQLPEQVRWLSDCKKTQTASALLKLFLDDSSETSFCWPSFAGCPRTCDFCVLGGVGYAQIKLHDAAAKFGVDIFAWWRRYVRQVCEFEKDAEGQEKSQKIHCFNLLNKQSFFSEKYSVDIDAEEIQDKKKNFYVCRICMQPKRGHVCPRKRIFQSKITDSIEDPAKYRKTDQSSANQEFERIFVEEQPTNTRLGRLFSVNTSTSTSIVREMLPTNIEID